MRSPRVALTAVALGLACAVGVATPANADHVADLFPESGECRMGGLVTGTLMDFWTSSIVRTTVKNGEIRGFTCQFKNLPTVFYEEGDDDDGYGEPILTVDRALIYTGFECWRSPDGAPWDTTSTSRFVLTPGGTGTLTCTF